MFKTSREARKLMTINVQLMIINVQDLREARKLMTINVQLMIINVHPPRAKREIQMF